MKKNKMVMYRVFRNVLGPIYRFWYKPKIYGKENILKDGPIILVGNHIHIMDQCNIVISTKRNIHYMAKKEYFDNKKVAWFFRSSGCIPVNRSIHDTDAKDAAIEVLNEKHALGLFPEGTRNSLKEERIKELYDKYYKDEFITYKKFYKRVRKNKTSFVNYLEELFNNKVIDKNDFIYGLLDSKKYLNELIDKNIITEKDYYEHILLPLKFGAVSMAAKTDAYLVPYGINGDYKFRGKNLTIRIGKPFKVYGDLAKANLKLAKEITKLIKESD